MTKDETIVEMKYIIKNYMLRLLGISFRDIEEDNDFLDSNFSIKEPIFYKDGYLYFIYISKEPCVCKVPVSTLYSKLNYTKEKVIFKELMDASKKYISRLNGINKEINYSYTLQSSICNALVQNLKITNQLNNLINSLENWACKTYEGKKVSFAFVIDTEKMANDDALNYLDFLKTDFAATITDGISSIIELDLNAKLLGYKSICINNKIISASLDKNIVPLRFSQIINNYIIGNRIGVFLLVSGDIMLAQNKELLYVKRNGNWTNFNSKRYITTLKEICENENILVSDELLSEIYASTLDVSFSHTGGIIALCNRSNLDDNLLSVMDDLTNYQKYNNNEKLLTEFISERLKKAHNPTNEALTNSIIKNTKYDFEKINLKRTAVLSLLKQNSILPTFENIDRRLRTELIGLDGATILDSDGKIIAIGAIIQNDSGSAGGGRGAAASKLSSFGGFAIKISTDGYIELYNNKEIKYVIK